MPLKADSLILGYADELIAEHAANLKARGLGLDMASLEGRLAKTLADIVRYVREGEADAS